MRRSTILAASRSRRLRAIVERAPVSRSVVRRFVAGTAMSDALRVTRELVEQGLHVSLDHLGEDTTDVGQAETATTAYLALLRALGGAGLTPQAEVSVKLSAVGLRLDPELALLNARRICAAAAECGTTVTFDMEDSSITDATYATAHALHGEFPTLGVVVQAYLRRAGDDCERFATSGWRVRLCKGAYDEPPAVAHQERHEVDLSYVRCLLRLMAGSGYPMAATHDPRLIAISRDLARRCHRGPDSYEIQLLYGVRPKEQRRLAAAGEKVRVYVPYGDEWYGYLMRRLAERPANVWFFLRSVVSTR
jgi:proline dehydrogenase